MNCSSRSRLTLIAAMLAVTSLDALAEMPPQTPVASGSSVDHTYALMITAGALGGAVIAGVVTNGLILPLYSWFAGTAFAETTVAGSMMAGRAGAGTAAFRGVMQTFGAVSGGLYANSLYQQW